MSYSLDMEEMLDRFVQLVPKVSGDKRFEVGVAENKQNGLFPFCYLAADPCEEGQMPVRFIKVIKVGEDKFRLVFDGFFIMYGAGVPSAWHPSALTAAELDEQIVWVWEQWFKVTQAVGEETEWLDELKDGPRSLPL